MHKHGLAKRDTSSFEGHTECFIRNSKVSQKTKRPATSGPFCFF